MGLPLLLSLKPFYCLINSPNNLYEVGTVITPILQLKKKRHREVKYLAQGHKPVGQDWNQSR